MSFLSPLAWEKPSRTATITYLIKAIRWIVLLLKVDEVLGLLAWEKPLEVVVENTIADLFAG